MTRLEKRIKAVKNNYDKKVACKYIEKIEHLAKGNIQFLKISRKIFAKFGFVSLKLQFGNKNLYFSVHIV